MKKLLLICMVGLFLTIPYSCKKDLITSLDTTGKVVFSIKVSEQGNSLKSSVLENEPKAMMISVNQKNGSTVIESKQIMVYQFSGYYISEPVSLKPGNYQLTKFILIDAEGNALYASPVEGSAKAYLVNDPLPIDFTVKKDETSKLVPEVLSTEESTPEDFGYETFSFEIVKIFSFQLSVFVYNETNQNFELTDAVLTIKNGDKIIFETNLGAVTNLLYLREDIPSYTIEIKKSGYKSYSATKTSDALKVLTEPLVVILEEQKIIILQPGEEGKDAMIEKGHINNYDNSNFGNYPGIYAMAWTGGGVPLICRSLMEFDLSNIPTSSKITKATLFLYSYNSLDGRHSQLSGSNAAFIRKIIQEWNENTVTWNNQPETTEKNQVMVPASENPDQNYEIDVTNIIQDIIKDPENGHGLMFSLQNESYYRSLIFASGDNSNSKLHPKLIIEF